MSDAWLESPLVVEAMARAERWGGSVSAADVLFELHDLMTRLEEACPGVPFDKILGAASPSGDLDAQVKVVDMLVRQGHDLTEVVEILGRDAFDAWLAQERDSGATWKQLGERLGVEPRELYLRGTASSASFDRQYAELLRLKTAGMSTKKAAVELGINYSTAYGWLRGKRPKVRGSDVTASRWFEIASYAKAEGVKEAINHFKVRKNYVYKCLQTARDRSVL